jgi:MYXO-CTERM domain-containing protein
MNSLYRTLAAGILAAGLTALPSFGQAPPAPDPIAPPDRVTGQADRPGGMDDRGFNPGWLGLLGLAGLLGMRRAHRDTTDTVRRTT